MTHLVHGNYEEQTFWIDQVLQSVYNKDTGTHTLTLASAPSNKAPREPPALGYALTLSTCKQCNAGLPSGAKLYVHIRGSQGEFGPLELGSRRASTTTSKSSTGGVGRFKAGSVDRFEWPDTPSLGVIETVTIQHVAPTGCLPWARSKGWRMESLTLRELWRPRGTVPALRVRMEEYSGDAINGSYEPVRGERRAGGPVPRGGTMWITNPPGGVERPVERGGGVTVVVAGPPGRSGFLCGGPVPADPPTRDDMGV